MFHRAGAEQDAGQEAAALGAVSRLVALVVGVVAAVAGGAMAAGCGGDDDAPIPNDARRNVMVVDDGFETSLPVFAGKVAAGYTVACKPRADAGGDGGGPLGISPEEGKAALLAELAVADDGCHLEPGIGAKPNPLADLESRRAAWNAAMRADQIPDFDLLEQIYDRLEHARFHGTATSGMIAAANVAARLVLVEMPLADASEVAGSFTCFSQADVDGAVTLLADADVRQAYVRRPPSTLDQALADLRRAQGVGLVNESFGHASRHAIELLLAGAGCPAVALGPYFEALYALDRGAEDAHPEPDVLFVQSAGNDGALIDVPADSFDCRPGSPNHILVGSTDIDGSRSDFTNFGACVDLYAPGSLVLAPVPGDWLVPVLGTSFSAPMVVRLSMFEAPAPFAPATALEALRGLREPNRSLPLRLFPPDSVLDPRGVPQTGALTAAGGGGTAAGVWASRRTQWRAGDRVSAVAARRALAPIRRVQRGWRY